MVRVFLLLAGPLLATSLLLLGFLLLAYLRLVRHPTRWYWSLPGGLTLLSGILFWLSVPFLVAPAYCVTLCLCGLLAAWLLPWVACPAGINLLEAQSGHGRGVKRLLFH